MVEEDGSFSGKCQHDSNKGWQDFKQAIDFDGNKPKYEPIPIVFSTSDQPEEMKKTPVPPGTKQIINKVIPIGYSGTSFLFYSYNAKQYILTSLEGTLIIPTLCSDWDYWKEVFPDTFKLTKEGDLVKKESTIPAIKERLIQLCQETNRQINNLIFLENGVYKEGDSIIALLGERIFVDGVESTFYDVAFKFRNMYQIGKRVPIAEPSTKEDFAKALSLIQRTTISKGADSWLILGVICAGYLSGISKWRSHCWITGMKASGKSEFRSLIIDKLIAAIGGINIFGSVSEAGIRQSIGNSRTIIVHDEAEHSRFIKAELEMIRVASSGGIITKGALTSRPVTFSIKSTFILLSISDSIMLEQDAERFIPISLKQSSSSAKEWADLEKDLKSFFTEEMGAKFCARMIENAWIFNNICDKSEQEFVKYFTKKYEHVPKNLQRIAQLYATPMAAIFCMLTDDIKSVEDIVEYIEPLLISLDNAGKVGTFVETDDNEIEENAGDMAVSVYNKFLDSQVRLTVDDRSVTYTIREFLDSDTLDEHKKPLQQYGLYYIPKHKRIKFKMKNSYLVQLFSDIGYPNYSQILRNVPGAASGLSRAFGTEVLKGLELPYPVEISKKNVVSDDENDSILVEPVSVIYIGQ
jgi:hypothetical protein